MLMVNARASSVIMVACYNFSLSFYLKDEFPSHP